MMLVTYEPNSTGKYLSFYKQWQQVSHSNNAEVVRQLALMQMEKWERVIDFAQLLDDKSRISNEQKVYLFSEYLKELQPTSVELSNYESYVKDKNYGPLYDVTGSMEKIKDATAAHQAAVLALDAFLNEEKVSLLSHEGFQQKADELTSLINKVQFDSAKCQSAISNAESEVYKIIHVDVAQLEIRLNSLSDQIAEKEKEIEKRNEDLEARFTNYNDLISSEVIKFSLEKATQLWSGDAQIHQSKSSKGLTSAYRLGVFSIIATPLVAIAAFSITTKVMDQSLIASAAFAGVTSLVLLTFLIWAIRLAVRMYMTEQHLANDCRNREAVTDAFVKLQAGSLATAEDAKLLLATIMRPTQDGIVADDGLPSGHLAALLVQLIDPKKK